MEESLWYFVVEELSVGVGAVSYMYDWVRSLYFPLTINCVYFIVVVARVVVEIGKEQILDGYDY